WELSIFVVNMLTGMGLALGIDYSLFVISRYREERTSGREQHSAIEAAGATASRAVLFSGSAFVIAMLGMLIVPNTVIRSLAADPEFGRGQIRYSTDGQVAALDVPIRGDDASDQALSAVREVRSTDIPELFRPTNAHVLVGGRTAEQVDYSDSVTNPTPYVF